MLDDWSNRSRSCVPRKVLGWRVLRFSRAVLALVPVAFALVACGRLAFPPVPDGKPTELPRSRTATTWTDTHGGTLQLKPDGTFTADDVCGNFFDLDVDDLKNGPRSGSGTWRDSDWKGQTSVDMSFKADSVSFGYDALRDGKTLKLWTYVGDPDEGRPLCILTPR
ncbi:hypothetical protein SAMN02745898_11493 [Streptomyces sp. 136MFCol5.1]|uniref:hypothetical protein n=1 Tax=Streptomyces sp. 136MFCol5.1 TaxID=1172182 RepID=UPI0008927784|nr:hypothetical protein [Streptomyces sp. 136MFCol5.1]SCZ15618.1 hypothetical protein SAMN02745898_11493 [Streptomyces sp. 136MFCol5.1]